MPLLLVMALLAAGDDDVLRSKDLFRRGQAFYSQGRYLDAIKAFEESGRLREHSAVRFNLARCYDQLKEVGRALTAYRAYLELSPDAKDKKTVLSSITRLEKLLAERKRQVLAVRATPRDAKITIDGQEAGYGDAVMELMAGEHTIDVTRPGSIEQHRTVDLSLTQPATLAFTLEPTPVVEPTPAPAFPPPPMVPLEAPPKAVVEPPPPAPVVVPPEVVATPPPAVEPRGRLWTWVSLGLLVAAGATGAICGVMSSSTSAELKGSLNLTAGADQLVGRAQTFALGANVGWGFTIGFSVSTLVLFFVEGSSS